MGCSIVVLMAAFAAAGIAVLISVFGISAFCLILGIVLLLLCFKKRNLFQNHPTLRIVLIVVGVLSLLIAAGGISAIIYVVVVMGSSIS